MLFCPFSISCLLNLWAEYDCSDCCCKLMEFGSGSKQQLILNEWEIILLGNNQTKFQNYYWNIHTLKCSDYKFLHVKRLWTMLSTKSSQWEEEHCHQYQSHLSVINKIYIDLLQLFGAEQLSVIIFILFCSNDIS